MVPWCGLVLILSSVVVVVCGGADVVVVVCDASACSSGFTSLS